jgi:formyltetrahydrofolate deformylase
MKNTAVLLVSCPDRKGIVAAIANFILAHNGNVLHADEHQDHELNLFLTRLEWDLIDFDLDPKDFEREWSPIAGRFQMQWRLCLSSRPTRMAIFVSRHDHCLADLLYRYHCGELVCEIPLIISNHGNARRLAEFYQIPFEEVPITPEIKPEAEEKALDLLRENDIDLVVLARYLQILSKNFVHQYPQKIINVHHSFLPAFVGAKPYHQAFQRGVKLIGATSHYVTEMLDEGPIIEQDVVRVSHRDALEDMIQKGRDLEKLVCSRAVRWHIENRILLYANKTVVFD